MRLSCLLVNLFFIKKKIDNVPGKPYTLYRKQGENPGRRKKMANKIETGITVGSIIYTPRFLGCEISAVFENRNDALDAGYYESTYYNNVSCPVVKDVLGKNTGKNTMKFACVLLPKEQSY